MPCDMMAKGLHMIAALFVGIAFVNVADEPVHPAFTLSTSAFESVWTKGWQEGQKKRNTKSAIAKFERQIDSYHVSPARKSPCSWALLLHPKLQIFAKANQAALQYWPEAEVQKAKDEMKVFADSEQQYLGFYITINEMPSFAGAYSTMSRKADPDNLKDVRCVLKVGDKIIQPLKQPGDLTASRSDQISYYSIPSTVYVNGKTNSSATANGSNGSWATATGSSTSSYSVTSYNTGSQPYSSYHSEFIVLFPLRDKDGKPLVTPQDKDLEIKVIKKSGENKTTFRLDEWAKAFE